MFIVKTSVRAFFLAMLPLAVLHGLQFGMGLLGYLGPVVAINMPTPDRVLWLWLLRTSIDGALLLVGHFIARQMGWGQRAVYGLIGGVAAACGYFVALRQQIWITGPMEGAIALAAILPIFAGMVSGFLYSQYAGRELVAEPAQTPGQAHAVPAAPAYEGPIQVRTSIAGVAIAALAPAVMVAALALMLTSLISFDVTATGRSSFLSWHGGLLLVGYPAQIFIATLIATWIPTVIFVSIVHGIARSMRRVQGRDYAIIGALTGFSFGLVFLFTGNPIFIVPFVIIGALAAGVYRRYAGVEPFSLPEAVLVREREALVGEDHSARKSHTIVINS